jgi:hypothetical protein
MDKKNAVVSASDLCAAFRNHLTHTVGSRAKLSPKVLALRSTSRRNSSFSACTRYQNEARDTRVTQIIRATINRKLRIRIGRARVRWRRSVLLWRRQEREGENRPPAQTKLCDAQRLTLMSTNQTRPDRTATAARLRRR